MNKKIGKDNWLNNTSFIILTTSLSLIFFSLKSVSAQSSLINQIDLKIGMQQLIDQAVGFFTPIFEVIIGDYSNGEYFFIKALFLILLFIIIFVILDRVPFFEGFRNIAMLVALIVSVLSVRFMSENNFILGLLLPYTTLGIAITTIVPFLIFAYGVHVIGLPGIGRKVAWIFFGIIFIILWIYKADQINPIGNQIYLWIIILIGGMLLFDRRIHAYFSGMNIKEFERVSIENEIANLQADLHRIMVNAGPSPSPEQKRTIERIRKRLRRLGARYET